MEWHGLDMNPDRILFLTSYNTPAYRIHFLECIKHDILQDQLLTKEEIRKSYYGCMAAYYSVDHSNTNEIEERMEHGLVGKVEAVFVEAMNRRELSDIEKDDIRRKQAIQKEELEIMMSDSERGMAESIRKFVDKLKKSGGT